MDMEFPSAESTRCTRLLCHGRTVRSKAVGNGMIVYEVEIPPKEEDLHTGGSFCEIHVEECMVKWGDFKNVLE